MLVSLHAKNFAIIDEIEVEFGEHLNIISGETGAGKSVIIGSINAALGGKVSKEIIRTGADYALVELVFSGENPEVLRCMAEEGLEPEDGEVVISRKIMSSGKNVFRVNGETVNASVVKELAFGLIDIHGQHEHQSLLKKSRHLEMLDRYAGSEADHIKNIIGEQYKQYRALKDEKEHALSDEEKRLRELSFLQYECNEIEQAKLVPGEEAELRQEHKRLANLHMIEEALSGISRLISEEDGAAAEKLGYALKMLGKVEEYDEELGQLYGALSDIESSLHDFAREVTAYLDRSENDGERFAQVEERLNTINHLTSRYGGTVEEVLRHAQECREQIEKYENYDRYLAELERKYQKAEQELAAACAQMTKLRRAKAEELTGKLVEALRDLNFLDVRFDIGFSETEGYTAKGTDEVEFLISTNPGEPLQPLSKVASGGELSRIMLALKSVFSDKDEIETMIFDEIDVGVSGRTAQMVSEKMARIAAKRQLLCITHLPQIAAMADDHFIIEKMTDGVSTKTGIRRLDDAGMTQEIARMLGGVEITGKVLESAAEMKLMATQKKQEFGRA